MRERTKSATARPRGGKIFPARPRARRRGGAYSQQRQALHLSAKPFAASRRNLSETQSPYSHLTMLYTIAVILVILWALGFFIGNVGGIIHALLVIAIIVVLLQVIRGNRVV